MPAKKKSSFVSRKVKSIRKTNTQKKINRRKK